jgi:hypothetical protein
MAINLNFKNDWKEFLSSKLTEMGFQYDNQISLEDNTIRYFKIKRRIISNKPRAIHESKELHVPSGHYKAYLDLKEIISRGGDIHPYLSRRIKNVDNNDLLLNEWGIHHLHFLPEGTKDILFIRFTDQDAFIIQSLPHGPDHSDVWVNTMLIDIINKNWSESKAQYNVINILGEELNAKERVNLRNKHYNVAVKVSDGKSYVVPGGGIMASGDCLSDIINCDKLFANLSYREELVRVNEANFRNALKISTTDPLEIKLMFGDQECWLCEPTRNVTFQLNFRNNNCNDTTDSKKK